jgi:hypothetical protein
MTRTLRHTTRRCDACRKPADVVWLYCGVKRCAACEAKRQARAAERVTVKEAA